MWPRQRLVTLLFYPDRTTNEPIGNLSRHRSDQDDAAFLTVLHHDAGTGLRHDVGAGDVHLHDAPNVGMRVVQSRELLLNCRFRLCQRSRVEPIRGDRDALAAQCMSTLRGAGASRAIACTRVLMPSPSVMSALRYSRVSPFDLARSAIASHSCELLRDPWIQETHETDRQDDYFEWKSRRTVEFGCRDNTHEHQLRARRLPRCTPTLQRRPSLRVRRHRTSTEFSMFKKCEIG